MKKILLILAVVLCSNAQAQFDSETMDLNNLNISVAPFPKYETNTNYSFPQNIRNEVSHKHFNGKDSTFISGQSIWIASLLENDETRVAAHHYGQEGYDFQPGPLNANDSGFDTLRLHTYNKVSGISRREVYDFLNYGTITDNIKNWPAGKNRSVKIGQEADEMAPFVDVNNDGLYEPTKGDYPLMKGDQMYWCVYNDMRRHTITNDSSIGFEVHASTYVFYCDTLSESNEHAYLNNSVFFHYKVLYKGEKNIKENRIAFFVNFDIGESRDDDVIAYDSTNVVAYGSNALSSSLKNNENAIIGVKVLEDPSTVNSFFTFNNNDNYANGLPRGSRDHYNYIKGTYRTNYSPSSKFESPLSNLFDTTLPGNDATLVVGMKPEKIKKGYVGELNYAIVYEYDDIKANFPEKTFARLQKHMNQLNSFDPNANLPICSSFPLSAKKPALINDKFILYPNPNKGNFTIQCETNSMEINEITVHDITGRIHHSEKEITGNIITINAFLTTGVYFVKIATDNGSYTKKMLIK